MTKEVLCKTKEGLFPDCYVRLASFRVRMTFRVRMDHASPRTDELLQTTRQRRLSCYQCKQRGELAWSNVDFYNRLSMPSRWAPQYHSRIGISDLPAQDRVHGPVSSTLSSMVQSSEVLRASRSHSCCKPTSFNNALRLISPDYGLSFWVQQWLPGKGRLLLSLTCCRKSSKPSRVELLGCLPSKSKMYLTDSLT